MQFLKLRIWFTLWHFWLIKGANNIHNQLVMLDSGYYLGYPGNQQQSVGRGLQYWFTTGPYSEGTATSWGMALSCTCLDWSKWFISGGWNIPVPPPWCSEIFHVRLPGLQPHATTKLPGLTAVFTPETTGPHRQTNVVTKAFIQPVAFAWVRDPKGTGLPLDRVSWGVG